MQRYHSTFLKILNELIAVTQPRKVAATFLAHRVAAEPNGSVKIYYSAQSQLDYGDAAMRHFSKYIPINLRVMFLIFLPGQEDIESLEASINLYANQTNLLYVAMIPG